MAETDAWPTNTLDSWEKFLRAASTFRFGSPFTSATLARGQANAAWGLSTSLERLLPESISAEEALEVESHLLREFQATARQHVPDALLPSSDSVLEWWCLMQHHGAPTRILDWTSSPYVAAYFAVANHWDCDGALWYMHPRSLVASAIEAIGSHTPVEPIALSAEAPHLVSMADTSRRTDRMQAQQSHFSYGLNILTSHQRTIADTCGVQPDSRGNYRIGRLIIPKAQKPVFLGQLQSMNVHALSLFPGTDGLGRRLNEQARLAFEPANRRAAR